MSLSEMRDVINRHNADLGVTAFIEVEKGDLVLFNYVVTFDNSFPDFTGDPIRDREVAMIRECRGISFDKNTGEVALRKFFKFFNIGQREETQPHMIDWSTPHVILTKEDGSMISPYFNNGVWEYHTKMGATDVASLADDFVADNPHYNVFAEWCRDKGVTPIFEFCSRKQKIVLDYPEDALILLAIRNNRDGSFVHYSEMCEIGERFGVPVVAAIEGSVTDPHEFIAHVRGLINQEGYVIRFDNGHMVKIKAEEYLMLHNMIDKLQREKDVLALVMSGTLDDEKAFMSDEARKKVDAFAEAVERGIMQTAVRLKEYANRAVEATGGDKKRIAMEYVNIPSVDKGDRKLLFHIVAGRNAFEVVFDYVKANISTGPRVDEVRHLFNARWDEFRDA